MDVTRVSNAHHVCNGCKSEGVGDSGDPGNGDAFPLVTGGVKLLVSHINPVYHRNERDNECFLFRC